MTSGLETESSILILMLQKLFTYLIIHLPRTHLLTAPGPTQGRDEYHAIQIYRFTLLIM